MTPGQAQALVGREFVHFKGKRYRLVAVAKHSETLEPIVVYRALYGEGGVWVRPFAMFFEDVDRDGYRGPRFRLAEDVAHGAAAGDWTPPARWRGFNLLGLFRAPTEGLAPDPRVAGFFPEWEFEALEEWGFNFARLPIDYRALTTGDDWTNLDEGRLALVDEAIELGRRHGVHVQVAMHRLPGYCILDQTEPFPLGTSPVAQEAARRLWSALARRWRGVPNEALSFNLLNEPTRHVAGPNYPPLAEALLAAVRAEDPARFVVVDGNDCASRPVPELYGVASVGQAFRGYAPFEVTHYGSPSMPELPKEPPAWPLRPGYGSPWMPEDALGLFRPALDAGEFCMVGEFGCRPETPHGVALAWMEHCLELWEGLGLGWALWNLRGAFGVLDSGRADVRYEDWRGHKLDRAMLDLLRRH